jgi:hypothetical protein
MVAVLHKQPISVHTNEVIQRYLSDVNSSKSDRLEVRKLTLEHCNEPRTARPTPLWSFIITKRELDLKASVSHAVSPGSAVHVCWSWQESPTCRGLCC